MHGSLDQRAGDAAVAIAVSHGLAGLTSSVIHSGSNMVVRLAPHPLVARVMTGTAVVHDDPRGWLERQVAVERYLAPAGLAVGPTPLMPSGPFCHDGLWVTFGRWVSHTGSHDPADEPARYGCALRALHAELREFDGELISLEAMYGSVEQLLAELATSDADRTRVTALRRRLKQHRAIFHSSLPAQALHGDVSLSNLLATREGLLWNDFEDTCRGPVQWDLASLIGDLRHHGAAADVTRAVLAAYGQEDETELAPFIAAQEVYFDIWRLWNRTRP